MPFYFDAIPKGLNKSWRIFNHWRSLVCNYIQNYYVIVTKYWSDSIVFERLDKYRTEAVKNRMPRNSGVYLQHLHCETSARTVFLRYATAQQSHPPIRINSIEEISSGQAQLVGTCLLDPDAEIRKEASPNLYFHSSPVSFLGSGFKTSPGSGDSENSWRAWRRHVQQDSQVLRGRSEITNGVAE